MEELLMILGFTLPIAYLVFGIIAMKKEVRIASFYNGIRVTGRWRAFFSTYLVLTGIGSLIALVVVLIINATSDAGIGVDGMDLPTTLAVFGLAAVITLVPGVLMYIGMFKRCPKQLRRRFFWDMFIILFGNLFKFSIIAISIFFRVLWRMNTSIEYVCDDGRKVYVYPGTLDVYDNTGNQIGRVTDTGANGMTIEFKV